MAIVARALAIPVVGRVVAALDSIEQMDTVIIDGNEAKIHIRPADDIYQAYTNKMAVWAQRKATYISTRDLPGETKDGIRIRLDINAGLPSDLDHLRQTGADGIGLYRTEISFMDSNKFPDVNRQADLYKRVIDGANGKPVVFRTMDIGGDKRVPYWNSEKDENPAMGWRAVRISLDKPTLMRHQMRALIRAAGERDLSLMFSMVTEVSEFDAALDLLNTELDRAKQKRKKLPKDLSVGTMLEVPALTFQLPSLLKRTDFIAVGTNDLFQFLFASDRSNPDLANRYDPMSPAALSFLHDFVNTCLKANVPVSLCGEIAGEPLEAMALIGLGFRHLSMAPTSIGPVKSMIRSLSASDLEQHFESLTDFSSLSMRRILRTFAMDNSVMI